jgi:hypothetical protein
MQYKQSISSYANWCIYQTKAIHQFNISRHQQGQEIFLLIDCFSYRCNIFIFDILTNYFVHVSSYTLSLSTLYSPTLYHMYCYNLPHS